VQDFPLKMQGRDPPGGSVITLEFELSPADLEEFHQTIGSPINGTLPISFLCLRDEPSISIPKQGPGQKMLSSKSGRIADFVANKIGIQYIPAVRTAEFAQRIVSDLVRDELSKVENDPKYKQALEDIAALQEPVLSELSTKITATMWDFLPNIATAKIMIQEGQRSYALREISELLLNDGVETPLTSKGDGVQSLAALAHAALIPAGA
jgi:putative ATP-dependent endonuclease of the OLD family